MISRTVYAWYYPEVAAVVQKLWDGHHHEWYERAYTKHQDTMHEEFLDTWRNWSGVSLGKAFPHAYPANGSSEIIKDLLLPPAALHVFEGEYEGYAAIARARGMKVVTHARNVYVDSSLFAPGDVFWASNPSAIDGNAWSELPAFLEALRFQAPGVRVYLDMTYVGATVRPVTDIEPHRHENVAAVIFSLSKPMGTYYHRVGGCYSRQPIDALWGNKWFKNLFSLKLGTELMKRFGPTTLPKRYAETRTTVMRQLVRDGRLAESAQPSNVLLLANDTAGPDEFRRAPNAYRFCLTEALDRHIRGEYR